MTKTQVDSMFSHPSSMRSVVIVQPFLADYRVKFFERLSLELRKVSVEVQVIHGAQYGDVIGTRNIGTMVTGSIETKTWNFRIFGVQFRFRKILPIVLRADLVVFDQSTKNLDAYFVIVMRNILNKPTALWGHGSTITNRQNLLSRAAQKWMLRNSQWFFAYTPLSADRATKLGAKPERMTVLRNTIDTRSLGFEIQKLTTEKRRSAQRSWNALYLGAVHEGKRIDLLLSLAKQIHQEDSNFRLTIAGSGSQEHLLRHSEALPYVSFVGHVDDHRKALIASESQIILIVGRVGLVAVDSFALELPIVTLEWPWHAPEFEYLNSSNSIVCKSAPELVQNVLEIMHNPETVDVLRRGCRESLVGLTIETMAESFADGVLKSLESK